MPGMARAYPEARATHFRLKDETWAIIGKEYRNGATARELAVKWMVSPTSIYRHACEDGWTKKACGDQRAWANAREVEAREAAAHEAAVQEAGASAAGVSTAVALEVVPASQRERAAVLFCDVDCDPGDSPGSAELARQAMTGSGRAMRAGMWNEARGLAMLAESYLRLTERTASNGMTPETAPLALLVAIAFGPQSRWQGRMSMIGARDNDPETEVKRRFWDRKEARDAGRALEEARLTMKYAEGVIAGRRIEARLRAEAGEGGVE